MEIDINLVIAARQGDKDSFAQVYDMIASDLYNIAVFTLGNSHDAEDVVSEVFIEAYKGISKLRDPEKFRPWMMRILSTRCKRKIAEYIKGKNTFDIESFINTLPEGGEVSADISEKVAVMDCMQRLSDQERQIIVLSVLHGFTTKEISGIVESPHGTVSSKLHRALAKLRRMLETDDDKN